MEQKIVSFTGKDSSILKKYLADGWVIKNISAANWSNTPICYVLLEKQINNVIYS